MVVPPRILQVCSWVDQPASQQAGGQAAGLGGSPPANSAGLQLGRLTSQPASQPASQQAGGLDGSPPANSAGLQLGCPAGLDLQNLKGVEEFSSMA